MSSNRADFLAKVVSGQVPTVYRQVMEDLQVIGQIPEEDIEHIATILDQEPGVLSRERMRAIVQDNVTEPSQVEAIYRVLSSVHPYGVERMIRNLRLWAEGNPEAADQFPSERLDAIQDRTTKLLRPYPALLNYWTARQLRNLVGKRLDDVDLICDLRPIFDDENTVIEGLMPLATLRLAYTNEEGEPSTFETVLSLDELDILAGQVAQAQEQLEILRNSVPGWVKGGWVEPD